MTEVRRLLGARSRAFEDLRISWESGKLTVSLPYGRRHFVRYRGVGEHIVLRTTIATRRQLEKLAAAQPQPYASFRARLCDDILVQNQHTESLCFRLTERDRLEAVATARLSTLLDDDVLYYAATLARESDRFESFLTDHDRW